MRAEDKEMIYAGIKYEGAAVYSRNLSTGATTICNDDAQKTFYDSIEWGRLGQIAINPQWSTSTVGSGSLYIYSKTEKKIFAKKLVKQGNDTYCPHSTDREDNFTRRQCT